MEIGKVMSVKPFLGTLATFHDMPTSPMAKLGRSAAAAVRRRGEFFMWMVCTVSASGIEVISSKLPQRVGSSLYM